MGTKRNMKFLPPKNWWLKPSGYHEEPYDLLDWMEAPIFAHPTQGALLAAWWALVNYTLQGNVQSWAVFLTAAFFVFWWQAFNFERLDWSKYPFYNVVWRILLALPTAALIAWLLGG